MQQAYMSLNPLIRSVIHESFRRAVEGIGLPEFPEQVFLQEIAPCLRSPECIFEENETPKLWKALLHGHIIATEVWDNKQVFYVRAIVGIRVMDIRLTYHSRTWHIQSIVSMYVLPIIHAPLFRRVAVSAAVLIAAALGYELHHPTAQSSTAVTVPAAGAHSTATTTAPALASRPPTKDSSPVGSVNSGAKVAESKPHAQTLTFTLAPGMSLHELSRFLHAHHLVPSAISFDMVLKRTRLDRSMKPGTYHFQSDMTEQQVVQVLQRGQSKS